MNKGILFFIGLLLGILICALIYYLDVHIPKIPVIIEKKEVVKQVDTVYVETPRKSKKQESENITDNTVNVENIIDTQPSIETTMYETEFSFEGEEHDDVFSDKLLYTRIVKVRIINADNQDIITPEDFFQSFEIQQWSTPIKNKITYHRNQNMIKIKGIEIDKVSVVFINDSYFIEIGNRYFSIPETISFEKLNPTQMNQ